MSFSAAETSAPPVSSLAHPLDDFYARARMPLPSIESIPGGTVPQPFRKLLVHEGDMTPTLEAFYGSSIHVEVLQREQREDHYLRQVVLITDREERRVEFGAIKIFLARFPRAARNDILAERLPLGGILAKYNIPHSSRPKGFLRVRSDDFINRALGLTGAHSLYGRRNTLINPEEQSLAEIVEILPPVQPGR